jgi:hypothetical protein
MDLGKAFIEKYGHRWSKKKDRRIIARKCCWGKCDNDMAVVYYGFPFCEHHMVWVDKQLDKMMEEHNEM